MNSLRPSERAKTDQELAVSIRKATTNEEISPKRKHVRACIVFTWDHKSSQAFWTGVKVQPIATDEVQLFKALIMIHKVLQEGHPSILKEALGHRTWIDGLHRGVSGEGVRGYGPLIREYVFFLLSKLSLHQHYPQFDGLFEYQEYLSLQMAHDPNEGYETVSDLMGLQDKIEQLQKLIFSHFRNVGNNECRISALVPLVQESYGIYKFITSMLRAMHSSMLGDDDALEPLRGRYDAQHYRLVKFYYECSNLRYLTSLITIPLLPQDPPNLLAADDEAPALPKRPAGMIDRPPTPPLAPQSEGPDEISEFWTTELDRQNQEYEEQQRILAEKQQAGFLAQQQAQEEAQRNFQDRQLLLAEQQHREHEALLAQQANQQVQGRIADLEQSNLHARAQLEQDQLLLGQYDMRVKALEGELSHLHNSIGNQLASKDAQIRSLQESSSTWRKKYETLARLYTDLRKEYFTLVEQQKVMGRKISSAEEINERKEKLEVEMKNKNLELASLIRERDRALHEKDQLKGSNKSELDKLMRELRLAEDRADDMERSKSKEVSTMASKFNREVANLEQLLRAKSKEVDDLRSKELETNAELVQLLHEREDELEVYKAGMDETLVKLHDLEKQDKAADDAMDAQIADLMLQKINTMIDSVLEAGVARVDDALYELDSSMQAGNQNASPSFVLSQIEKASDSATEFATAFNSHIADGPNSSLEGVIKAINIFAGAVVDVCGNTKGLGRLATDDKTTDSLIAGARHSAEATIKFFRSLLSVRLEDLDVDHKIDVVIIKNHDVQMNLQKLNKMVEAIAPGFGSLTNKKGDLGDLVDDELDKAAGAIAAAVERLAKLKNKPRDGFSSYELKVHDSILDAAMAITNAITRLIAAATTAQREIVQAGSGSSSRTAFYKKNNRWTEGLISAAKAVASSTNTLIETSDGVISDRNSPEQLIVASNEVAASTAQLVAASRVKAGFRSSSQENLEHASKAVGVACRALVRQVQSMIREGSHGEEQEDYTKLGAHEFKVREMEQQVEILKLENSLSAARHRLGEMRKISYQE